VAPASRLANCNHHGRRLEKTAMKNGGKLSETTVVLRNNCGFCCFFDTSLKNSGRRIMRISSKRTIT
jgi:hypothetical protein